MGRTFLAAVVAAFTLGACAPEQSASTAPEGGCDVAVQNAISFTTNEPVDIVEARAFGPDCARAVLTLALRGPDGAPLWAYAAPYSAFAYGVSPGMDIPRDQVEERLADWVNVILDDTSELPEWPESLARLQNRSRSGRDSTPLDRDSYEALRALKAKRLCYGANIDAIECVVLDPETKTVRVVYRG